MLSLENISAIKVAITFWDKTISEKKEIELEDQDAVLDKMKEKLHQLPVPKFAKDTVYNFIQPIGIEIISWMKFHEWFTFRMTLKNKYTSGNFVWALDGTIDKGKTAERIMEKNEDIESRYILACIYCLEDHILILWDQLNCFQKSNMKKSSWILVSYWSYVINNESIEPLMRANFFRERVSSREAFAFRASCVKMYNEVATKYFLDKLTPNEKRYEILKAVNDLNRDLGAVKEEDRFYHDKYRVFRFLFQKVDKEDQVKMHPALVLRNFMCWPCITQFMDVARIMYDSLIPEYFNLLLMLMGYEYYLCNVLFEEFWNNSPLPLRQAVRFPVLRKEHLATIFKNKDRGKKFIIFQVMSLAEKPFSKGYRDFFQFVLSCCCSTKQDLRDIKEASLEAFRLRFGENDKVEVLVESYFDEQAFTFQ